MQTENIPDNKPALTLAEMIEGIDAALREPLLIGWLMGYPVHINRLDRTLSFAGITCAVDHHALVGTRIRDHALGIMADLKP